MDENGKNFYANAVNFATSIYDVTLIFKSQSPQIDQAGKIMEIKGQPVLNVAEEIVVRMSPQHAKSLAALLAKNIADYEKQFNINLPVPPEIEAIWKDLVRGA